MQRKITISLIVGGMISVVTLFLAFRNVPVDQLMAYLGTIDYWWILPTVAIVVLTFLIRTLRWKLILKEICDISFWQAFHFTMIAFMMNCVLPGRVGEFARPALLKQQHGIPMATGLSTIAGERIFDLISLITLFVLVFPTTAGSVGTGGSYFGHQLDGDTLKSIAAGMIRLSIALVVFIALMTIDSTRNGIKRLIGATGRWLNLKIPRLNRFTDTIANFLQSMVDNFTVGLSLVRNPLQSLYCGGLTMLIWLLTVLSYWVFAIGCPGITLSLLELTTVMVIVSFTIALPSVPGFWGVWEAGGVFALSIYGIAEKDALGYTLVNHAAQIFPVIGIGLISALITSVNILHLSHNGTAADPRPRLEGE